MTDEELKAFMRDAIDAMRQSGLRTERVLRELVESHRELIVSHRELAREQADMRDEIRAMTHAIFRLLDGREPGPGTA